MRHGKKVNHLSRKYGHRKSMLANIACSLIQHKRVTTTLAKAKALRRFIEPVITKSKTDSIHTRRTAIKYLADKRAVSHLFREIAPKIVGRNGGYTRILKTGHRAGDGAEMCFIELVDFNANMLSEAAPKKAGIRRGGKRKNQKKRVNSSDQMESSQINPEKYPLTRVPIKKTIP